MEALGIGNFSSSIFGHFMPWIRIGMQPKMLNPDPDEMRMHGSAKPCLEQVDPDKDFAATLALVFPRRRIQRVVIGAKSPLRVFAVSAAVLQGVDFDVTFEVAAQGERFAALGTEEGFAVGSRGGGDGLVGLGPVFLHCVL